MDALTIRPCTVDEICCAPNRVALMEEYAQESRTDELPPIDVQWEHYKAMENIGIFMPIGAFIGEEMIGFVCVICNILPHFGALFAVTESFFVASAHRKSGAGLRLLRAAEQKAREMGSPCLMVSAPRGGVLEQIMPRMGYRHSNSVFVRRLAA